MIEISRSFLDEFDSQSRNYFAHRRAEAKDVPQLLDSVEYSFFNGGKRFRPMMCYAVADALGLDPKKVTGFAMALECIHTYSLIHDDLPCMDDDNERRGQPTNHVKFSEDTALLAGDSLLTEAFKILAEFYPENCGPLVSILSEGSGLNGMIRGQVLDLGKGSPVNELSDLINLHELKTGRLIALCFQGPCLLAGKNPKASQELGLMVGLAFQVKDDLLDAEEDGEQSFIHFLGKQGTENYLASLTEKIFSQLQELDLNKAFIAELINFNLNREK